MLWTLSNEIEYFAVILKTMTRVNHLKKKKNFDVFLIHLFIFFDSHYEILHSHAFKVLLSISTNIQIPPPLPKKKNDHQHLTTFSFPSSPLLNKENIVPLKFSDKLQRLNPYQSKLNPLQYSAAEQIHINNS